MLDLLNGHSSECQLHDLREHLGLIALLIVVVLKHYPLVDLRPWFQHELDNIDILVDQFMWSREGIDGDTLLALVSVERHVLNLFKELQLGKVHSAMNQ